MRATTTVRRCCALRSMWRGALCAMATTRLAMYWAGVHGVVFGTSEATLAKSTLAIDGAGPALQLPCRELFQRSRPWLGGGVEVQGPLLEKEVDAVHHAFWPGFLVRFASVHG
mmetsp:Transcript_21657/g.60245  ORF Transcript_21657/g.60245 Transcript_21657/m.60245 type:complete len:113 (+) Transcript_21657:105-443(+)